MPARSIWSGSISFGLVNIPIGLYTAARDRTLHFHMLSDDGTCRLRRKLYCPSTGKEYEQRQTLRGYEISPDRYVVLRKEDFDAARPRSSRVIDIRDFVDSHEISPVHHDRTYYVLPQERGVKGYALLLQAMSKLQKSGVGTLVLHGREHIAALSPRDEIMTLQTLRFADEVIDPHKELTLPQAMALDPREAGVAEQLIQALSGRFEPGKYHDEYRARLLALIDQKAQGEPVTLLQAEKEHAPQAISLMEALQRSLAQARSTPAPEAEADAKPRRRRKSA